VELCNRRKDGRLFWERAVISPVARRPGDHDTLHRQQARHYQEPRARSRNWHNAQRMERSDASREASHTNSTTSWASSQAMRTCSPQLDSAHPGQARVEQISAVRPSGPPRSHGQLLVFSRKNVRELRVLDLNAVVTDVEKMLSHLIGEDVETVVRWRPSCYVRADRGLSSRSS